MARQRIPTSLRVAAGAFEHDPQRARDRENEPQPPGPLGDTPAFLSDLAKTIWKELEGQVAEGVLSVSDRMFLEVTCSLMARHRSGEILKAAEYHLIITCLAKLGMTPADRSRINAPTKKKQDSDDTFSRLANSGRGGTAVKQ